MRSCPGESLRLSAKRMRDSVRDVKTMPKKMATKYVLIRRETLGKTPAIVMMRKSWRPRRHTVRPVEKTSFFTQHDQMVCTVQHS